MFILRVCKLLHSTVQKWDQIFRYPNISLISIQRSHVNAWYKWSHMCSWVGFFFLSHLENEALMRNPESPCKKKKSIMQANISHLLSVFHNFPLSGSGNTGFLVFFFFYISSVKGVSNKPLIFEEYKLLARSIITNHVSTKTTFTYFSKHIRRQEIRPVSC